MRFIFDILILGILIGGGYAGIRFGFIKIAEKPIKIIASLIFAFSLCSVIGKGIISPMIQGPVTNYIKDFMYENCKNLNPDNVVSEIPTLLKMAGAVTDSAFAVTPGQTTDEIIEGIITRFTVPFSDYISVFIAFIILFFVGKLLIKLGIYLVNNFCSGGILAKVNQIMGFVLAGFLSILAAWAFVSIVDFFFHLRIFDNSTAIQNFGNGGLLFRLFNKLSPLELLLSF